VTFRSNRAEIDGHPQVCHHQSMMTMRTLSGLSREEIDTFHREGYLVVENVLPVSALDSVIAEVTREVTARAGELVAAGRLSRTYEELDFGRQLIAIDAEARGLVAAVSSGALSGPAIFEIIRHPGLLDLAESLCGPELIASSVYRLRPKLPRDARGEVPWHQDSSYFAQDCDQGLIVTIWIPLVDAHIETGCLYVLPRMHQSEVFRHQPNAAGTYLEIEAADLPDGKPVAVPIRKGGALLMTNRTPHASFENTSDSVRWSMDLRYQGASLPTNAEQDLRNDGSVPPACYPPARDFLVRSRERPEDVVTDAAVFHELRTRHRTQYDAGFANVTPVAEKRRINPFSLRRW